MSRWNEYKYTIFEFFGLSKKSIQNIWHPTMSSSKILSNPIITQEILKHYFNQDGVFIDKANNIKIICKEFRTEVEFYLRMNGIPWNVTVTFISNEVAKQDLEVRRKQREKTPRCFWFQDYFDDENYDTFYSNYKF